MLRIGSVKGAARSAIGALVAGGAVLFVPATASAHFILNEPLCWEEQDSVGYPQKGAPCAADPPPPPDTGLEPATTVYVPTHVVNGGIAPGATVSITVTVTVPHTGWYRVALVKGASSTQTTTTMPDPLPTPANATECSALVPLSNPVWSPTQPVIADNVPTGSRTFQVTIPENAVCTDADPCSLQVIMVMSANAFPDCFYHHCADISSGVGTAADGGPIVVSSSSSSSGSSSGGHSSSSSSSSSSGATSSSSSSSGATSSSSSSSGATSSSSSSGSAGSSSSSGATGTSTGGTTTTGSSSSSGASGTSVEQDGGANDANGGGSSGGCGMAAGGGSPATAGVAGFLLFAVSRRRRAGRSSAPRAR